MHLLADIAVGKSGGAEIFFLVGMILSVIAAVVWLMAREVPLALLSLAVGCGLFGWLLL